MKQQINALLDEERGVSPVIGVILMVAITVILAAVIGTFVLGLGDSLEQAPQATLNAEGGAENVTISHNGGDSIAAGDLRITVENSDNSPFNSSSGFTLSDEEFNVGDSIDLAHGFTSDTSAQVQVIHVPSESIILNTEVEIPA